MGFRKVGSTGWKDKASQSGVKVRRVVPAASEKPAKIVGTPQQEAIWERMVKGRKHVIVNALAGTGKTFTMLHGLRKMGLDRAGRTAFVAFNKSTSLELAAKAPSWVKASTFHSLLYGVVRDNYGDIRVDGRKTSLIFEKLAGEYNWMKTPMWLKFAMEKVVGLLKNTLIEADEIGIAAVCDRYGIDLEDKFTWAAQLISEAIQESKDDTAYVDCDDLIWLPVVNDLELPQFDTMVVDEYQDTNACQEHSLVRMANRLILVGDENQAIYGFRGAGTDSIQKAIEKLGKTKKGVDVLPLTFTRRCPKTHVELAKKLVPDFEALPEAPEGELDIVAEENAILQMKPGDLVICRLNAPVVSTAFRLLRMGTRANIQGRDLGRGLKAMIRRLRVKSGKGSVKELLDKLDQYAAVEVAKLRRLKRPPEAKITSLEDKISCLTTFCEGCVDVAEVEDRIDKMFTEEETGGERKGFVLLSSVHRVKGMEADTVWVLYPELMPFEKAVLPWEIEQEHHIRYVAFTRSKRRLVMIPKPYLSNKED
jgi:DNA helicase-2/ATP-dependent DNA helicase PcrA